MYFLNELDHFKEQMCKITWFFSSERFNPVSGPILFLQIRILNGQKVPKPGKSTVIARNYR